MKKTTRLLSFLLALTLIIGVLAIAPVSVSALDDGEFTYTVDGSDATITGLVDPDDFSGEINIPDTIDGKTVVAIADDAFKNLGTIEEITLPKYLNTIGERAFYGDRFWPYVIVGQGTLICNYAFGYGDDPDGEYDMTIVGTVNSPAYQYAQSNATVSFIDIDKYSNPEYHAYIWMTRVDENGIAVDIPGTEFPETYNVLQNLEVGGNLPEGASFDLNTFTLTLTNFNHPDFVLSFRNLIDHELNIKVVGECALADVNGYSERKGLQLRFSGEGALTINDKKIFSFGIRMTGYDMAVAQQYPRIFFGEFVKLNVSGSKGAVYSYSMQEDAQPFIAENDQALTVNTERYAYDSSIYMHGYISDENLPDSNHPYEIGDSVLNANDPGGLYCTSYSDGGDGSDVYRYVYDQTHDLKLVDYSVAPTAWNENVFSFERNRYGTLVTVRTQSYYDETYEIIRIGGTDYLINESVAADLSENETVSVECDAYPFDYIGTAASKDGYCYAVVTGDPIRVTIDGPNGQNPNAPTETVTAVFINPNGPQWVGCLATSKDDPQGVYTYAYNDEEDEYIVEKYIYSAGLNHYFYDSDFETEYLSPSDFNSDYTPVLDSEQNNEWIQNPVIFRVFNAHLYEDGNGTQYACTTDYVYGEGTEEITGVYTFSEIPELSTDEEKQYYFTPANINPSEIAQLTPVLNHVVTNSYEHVIPSVFKYNENAQVQTIDALDFGNVWDYPLISSNPDCQPCYIPFTAEVDTEHAYVQNEYWTNVKDGSTSSKVAPAALKPGYQYKYTAVIKANPGYKFSDQLAFTYLREAAPNATLTFSYDNKVLFITDIETVTFMLDTPALGTVTNTYNGVNFTWKASKGAAKYRVFRKEGRSGWLKIADTKSLSYEDKKVKSGVNYTYTVRCISADGKVLTSGYDTVGKSITYVAAPRITKFENVNAGLKINWSASKGAVYYRVMYKSGRTWVKLADVRGTTYTATKIASGTKRYYTVRAMNAKRQFVSGYNTTGWPATYIAPPALPKLTNTKNGVLVKYTKPRGSVYVRVMRKTAKGKWVKIADTTASKIVDKTAKNNVKYYYTVRCIAKGGKTFQSGYNATGKSIKCVR